MQRGHVIGAKLLEGQVALEVVRGASSKLRAQTVVGDQALAGLDQPCECSWNPHEVDSVLQRDRHFGRELRADHTRADRQILNQPMAEVTVARKVDTYLRAARLVQVRAPPHRCAPAPKVE